MTIDAPSLLTRALHQLDVLNTEAIRPNLARVKAQAMLGVAEDWERQ